MGRRKHKRSGGSNYIDLPSDEDTEIETHAHRDSASGKTHYDYLAFQTKRTRSNSQGHFNPIDAPAAVEVQDSAEVPDANVAKKTRYQVMIE